jgi:thymidylate kinase
MDGSGKSTILREVAGLLEAQDVKHHRFAFPSRHNGAIGGLIRDVLEGKVVVQEEAMLWLFTAEGVQMETTLHEAAQRGEIVLCDRHTAISALVYQTVTHFREDVRAVNRIANFTAPDRIYIVDVPVDVALSRRKSRGGSTAVFYEPTEIKKLEDMRLKYLNLVEDFSQRNPDGDSVWCGNTYARLIDGTLPVAVNAKKIVWEILGAVQG